MSIDKKRQVRKDITSRRWIVVDFGFWHHRGNRRPHFSITGTVYDKDHGDRRDKYIESCGCIHDQIREHFPELAHLIRWHLVDDDATPMHYLANGAHWLEYHHGISQFGPFDDRQYRGRQPLEIFRDQVVFRDGVDTWGDLLNPITVDAPSGVIFEQYADSKEGKRERCRILRERVERWAENRQPPLIEDMGRDMERAGVEYIEAREAVTA